MPARIRPRVLVHSFSNGMEVNPYKSFNMPDLTFQIRWGLPVDIPRPSLVLQIPIHRSVGTPRERSHPGLIPLHRVLPYYRLGLQHRCPKLRRSLHHPLYHLFPAPAPSISSNGLRKGHDRDAVPQDTPPASSPSLDERADTPIVRLL